MNEDVDVIACGGLETGLMGLVVKRLLGGVECIYAIMIGIRT